MPGCEVVVAEMTHKASAHFRSHRTRKPGKQMVLDVVDEVKVNTVQQPCSCNTHRGAQSVRAHGERAQHMIGDYVRHDNEIGDQHRDQHHEDRPPQTGFKSHEQPESDHSGSVDRCSPAVEALISGQRPRLYP